MLHLKDDLLEPTDYLRRRIRPASWFERELGQRRFVDIAVYKNDVSNVAQNLVLNIATDQELTYADFEYFKQKQDHQLLSSRVRRYIAKIRRASAVVPTGSTVLSRTETLQHMRVGLRRK